MKYALQPVLEELKKFVETTELSDPDYAEWLDWQEGTLADAVRLVLKIYHVNNGEPYE